MTRDEQVKLMAPVVPPETCPLAESLQSLLSGLSGDVGTFREELDNTRRKTWPVEEVVERLLDFDQLIAGVSLRVEELRQSNERLRSCGRYWREAHRETDRILELAKAAYADLERELGINPERNAEIARVAGKPVSALEVSASMTRRDFKP